MKKTIAISVCTFVPLLLCVRPAFGGTEDCPTNSHTSTTYINSIVTLKILLVEFNDVRHRTSPSAYTVTDFENLLVSSGTYVTPTSYSPDGDAVYGSLRDYYEKMSNGNLTITGYVVNNVQGNIPVWVTLGHDKSYYHSFGYANSPIFTDVMDSAIAQGLGVSWSDNVAIIYAGTTYYLFKGLNPMASGSLYIMGERHADPGDPPGVEVATARFSRIGVHCHEFGHILGIPHSTGSRADIMDAGRRNGGGAAPAPLNPIARWTKGWLTPTLISSNDQRDAYYSLTAPQVFRINSNSSGDYFLIENRRFDQNMVIGATSVPDYNNTAWMPISWTQNNPSTSIQKGILVWRVLGGGPAEYGDNGLVYASGCYGYSYPDYNRTETDAGVVFPGSSGMAVLGPWSDSRNPYGTSYDPNIGTYNNLFVPNTKPGTNVGMQVLSENPGAGYFTLYLYVSDPPTQTYSGTISANTTWSGATTVTGVVTVAAGSTLNLMPGTAVSVATGAGIIVYGQLATVGTSSRPIAFDRSGTSGTWGGIVINSGGSANIQYCDISNASIGIDLEGSALASIEHCNLSGINCYGIKAANATASNWAIIRNSTISSSIPIYCYYGQVLSGQNTLLSACQGVFAYGGSATVHSNLIDSYIEGIFALNYSTVSLLGATDGRGHNRILPTDATLYAEHNSSIDAGEPAGGTPGYNSFYGGCIDAQMVAVDDGHILAQYNWWNDDFSSITFNGGTADNSNPLDYDPNGGMGKVVVAEASAKTTRSGTATDPFFDADLLAALISMQRGRYDDARELLSKKFTGAISVGMKKYILAQLAECYKREGRTDFPEFLNADVRPTLAKADDLYVESLELESKWYIQSGLYTKAKVLLEGMRSEYAQREQTYKHVLFNLGNLCYSQLGEVNAAGEYLEELKAKYPNDVLTWHAKVLLGERDIAPPKPGLGKTQPEEEAPKSFAFSQNYPNPFNPSTRLKYALPAAGDVSLVVYDVLGREVAVLTNGYHEAGYHSAIWNATTTASGVYFARLTVKTELGGVIFNKVNKLLLMK